MAFKPTWARLHGLFGDRDASALRKAGGSTSPSPPVAPTTVQDWDWDLPPAAGLTAQSPGAEQASSSHSGDASLTLRERRIALEEDVANLRKTLLQEGNIHRALERALRRAAGILPRLPAYVPREMCELLGDVALLEEEVTHLEEHVVCLREDLYKEALYFSSATQRLSGGKAKVPSRKKEPRPGAAPDTDHESAPKIDAASDEHRDPLRTNVVSEEEAQELDAAAPGTILLKIEDFSQEEQHPGSAPDVKHEPDVNVLAEQSKQGEPSSPDIEASDADVADVKQGPRKDSVVARLLQAGGKTQATATSRLQGPLPTSRMVSAKTDAGSSQVQKRPSSKPSGLPVEGSAGHRVLQTSSVGSKNVTARHGSSRHSSVQSSPQVSPKVTPRPLPCPPTSGTVKGSPSVTVKPQKRATQGRPPRSDEGRVEKDNRSAAASKKLKHSPQITSAKSRSVQQRSSGPRKASSALASLETPAATVTASSAQSATPVAPPAATPSETSVATPAASPKFVPLSAASTPKFLPLSSAYLQDGVKSDANKLSEEMVHCLMDIYCKLAGISSVSDADASSVVSRSTYASSSSSRSLGSPVSSTRYSAFPGDVENDPYGVCCEGMVRETGSYADFREITATSFDHSRVPASAALYRRHRVLLKKLSVVNLRGLTHQQKLAFWINTYNVCMMHSFLEHGIPSSPHKTFALMRKAAVNVGGYLLNPLTIEHFILRLPSQSRLANPDGMNMSNDVSQQSAYALQWPEPLVTFALSCGSRSSPAVRVYTPGEVDAELEAAKRDYLEAAIGITTDSKIVIPKLLEWYLRDFAKDAQSLVEWICQQLPPALQEAAQECIERVEAEDLPHHIEVMPYDFDFRYLFAT